MTCPVPSCDRPRHDGWTVCKPCARALNRALAEAPALATELNLTMARQRAGGANGSRSAEHPLPYDTHASTALHQLRRVLTHWARQAGVTVHPGDATETVARRLHARHDQLIVRVDAHQVVQDITDATRDGWIAVQPARRGRISLPDACPEPGCRAGLYAAMHDVGDPRPNLVWCDGPQRHEWRPEQWLRLGHRLGYGRTA